MWLDGKDLLTPTVKTHMFHIAVHTQVANDATPVRGLGFNHAHSKHIKMAHSPDLLPGLWHDNPFLNMW